MKKGELELLKKYLTGEATPAESRYVQRLLSRGEKDDSVKKILMEEWIQTSADNELGIEIEEVWKEFKQKVANPLEAEKRLSGSINTTHFSRRLPLALVAASVLVLLISAIVLVFQRTRPEVATKGVVYNMKQTGRGEKLNISLPDGSFIKLNSSTQLRIPSDYNTTSERVVYLEGEAFFEIAKYQNKPFKVISGDVTTEVLGTSFNVNTFSKKEGVSVAVVEGRVRVANNNNQIILHPTEMTTVGSSTQVFTKRNFDIDFVTGWRNNLLIFDRVSFEEIIEKLKLWYGVEFIVEGKPQHTGKYSGRFENKSLQLVLEGLGFSSAFEYKIIDKTVYLNFK